MSQMNKWHQLEDDASRATVLLQKLTSNKEELRESLPRGTEPMPRSELHFCNGLAFTFVRKLGAGISFEAGHGFVIRKIYEGSGEGGRPVWAWSAPLFLTVAAAGVGLTLGYTEIDSVIVLDTPEAVQAFTKSQFSVDTDITGAAGASVGTHLPATAANMSNMQLSDKSFTYSITRGAILDVSLTGLNYALDPAMNRGFYGGSATPQAVLDGAVEAPEPMQELYGALDRVLHEYYDSAGSQPSTGPAGHRPPSASGTPGAGPSAAAAPAPATPAVEPLAAVVAAATTAVSPEPTDEIVPAEPLTAAAPASSLAAPAAQPGPAVAAATTARAPAEQAVSKGGEPGEEDVPAAAAPAAEAASVQPESGSVPAAGQQAAAGPADAAEDTAGRSKGDKGD